ncbi:gamma-glutamylcyclotransferase family protein [Andreprevotia chitinilytica]|uniref:gamma-glutamylcyclotransferase family protein n=1 Tax=Andreprevotia chitinilytica TaxID=396808 RepID=UPI000552B3CD|nr:gamma-glutamylcyclotransferase family protein [Andreprevotia chitinilytica]
MSATQQVFVYGTLKQGGWNHKWLNGAPCQGAAVTVAQYALYATSYPFLVEDEALYPVEGELYAVDADGLAHLDVLEGHPDDYVRKEIAVRNAVGEVVTAWAYFHSQPQGDLLAVGVFDNP